MKGERKDETKEESLEWIDELLGIKKSKEEEKKYANEEALCPICGNIVSIYDERCPYCGAEFAPDIVRCPYCGTIIPADSITCPNCGKMLVEQYAVCPRCGNVVSVEDERCPYCGAEFSMELYRCSNCGGFVSKDAVVCPHCGAKLIDEIVTKEEEERKKEEILKLPKGAMPIGIVPEERKGEVKVEKVELVIPEAKKKEREGVVGEQQEITAKRVLYPFTAIVDQEDMKLALILNAIDPGIGGVLIMGHKGTAKSIAVRGLTEILPEIDVIKGCKYNDDPADPETWCWECRAKYGNGKVPVPIEKRMMRVVDLPLNATADRVVGTIDVEKILTEGLKAFEPGLLAEANRGILYIDEINLLDDYIVDLILDAAAMGVVTVEREGISVSYPSKFIIVGTMNPEEGALRPQLLDRIGIMVKVKGVENVNDREEIIRRVEEFKEDPEKFREKYKEEQEKLKIKIIEARKKLEFVKVPQDIVDLIAKIALKFGVDGHRADIIMTRAARALAAFEGRMEVTLDDVTKAAEFALPHRMRKRPFEEEEFSLQKLKRVVGEIMEGY